MMKIIESERNISFLPIPNEAQVVLDIQLPPFELITSALGLVFDGDRVLLPKLIDRGWDIPGSHIEPGESPEEAFHREVFEELAAKLNQVGILGYQKFIIQAPKPEGYKYPHPVSYQAFFWATVETLEPFVPTVEVEERGFFTPDQAQALSWIQKHEGLYKSALQKATNCSS
ncbi:MAG: NUDIX domain-containing protein [Chloroflexota bacterium]